MSPVQMSKLEAVMRIVLDFNRAFNRQDVAGMMQLMSENCVFESPQPAPDGTAYAGKEDVTRFWENFFRESPGIRAEIEEVFGLGERCVLRCKYQWVDQNGTVRYMRGMDVFRVTGGFIHEQLSYIKG